MTDLKKTPLNALHIELGAKMVDFGGWHMPVQYGPILDEVRTVRNACGLFDLGHMGRFHITGPDALKLVDAVSTNWATKIPVGAIRYSLFCLENGNPIDDVLLYREEDAVFIVVNAANLDRDLAHLRQHAEGLDCEVVDQSRELDMLALQGQHSEAILQRVTEGCDLSEVKYYRYAWGTVCGIPNVRISRTGYTGEDGFEVYIPPSSSKLVWNELLAAGELAALGVRRLDVGVVGRDGLLVGCTFDQTEEGEQGGVVHRGVLAGRGRELGPAEGEQGAAVRSGDVRHAVDLRGVGQGDRVQRRPDPGIRRTVEGDPHDRRADPPVLAALESLDGLAGPARQVAPEPIRPTLEPVAEPSGRSVAVADRLVVVVDDQVVLVPLEVRDDQVDQLLGRVGHTEAGMAERRQRHQLDPLGDHAVIELELVGEAQHDRDAGGLRGGQQRHRRLVGGAEAAGGLLDEDGGARQVAQRSRLIPMGIGSQALSMDGAETAAVTACLGSD